MRVKDIVLVALLAVILKISQEVLSFLPNIEIVSLLILVFARHLKPKLVFFVAIMFSFLNTLMWGISIATLGYYVIWAGFALLSSYLGKFIDNNCIASIYLALFGISFGGLFAIFYLPLGLPVAISYWIGGLTFDYAHALGNFFIGALLFSAFDKGFQRVSGRLR